MARLSQPSSAVQGNENSPLPFFPAWPNADCDSSCGGESKGKGCEESWLHFTSRSSDTAADRVHCESTVSGWRGEVPYLLLGARRNKEGIFSWTKSLSGVVRLYISLSSLFPHPSATFKLTWKSRLIPITLVLNWNSSTGITDLLQEYMHVTSEISPKVLSLSQRKITYKDNLILSLEFALDGLSIYPLMTYSNLAPFCSVPQWGLGPFFPATTTNFLFDVLGFSFPTPVATKSSLLTHSIILSLEKCCFWPISAFLIHVAVIYYLPNFPTASAFLSSSFPPFLSSVSHIHPPCWWPVASFSLPPCPASLVWVSWSAKRHSPLFTFISLTTLLSTFPSLTVTWSYITHQILLLSCGLFMTPFHLLIWLLIFPTFILFHPFVCLYPSFQGLSFGLHF